MAPGPTPEGGGEGGSLNLKSGSHFNLQSRGYFDETHLGGISGGLRPEFVSPSKLYLLLIHFHGDGDFGQISHRT